MYVIQGVAGMPAREMWSFEEVAAEIGCTVGELHYQIDDARRHPARAGLVSGFRALQRNDYARLAEDRGVSPTIASPAGFDGIVRYDEVEHEFGIGGVPFAALIERLKVAVVNHACLSADGRAFAKSIVDRLTRVSPPAGVVGAVAVKEWRDRQRARERAKFNEAGVTRPLERRG